jgi:hypothetical protein
MPSSRSSISALWKAAPFWRKNYSIVRIIVRIYSLFLGVYPEIIPFGSI